MYFSFVAPRGGAFKGTQVQEVRIKMVSIKKVSALSLLMAIIFAFAVIPVYAPANEPTVPDGFKATKLAEGLATADGLKGITSALFRAGNGHFGHYLYVARSDNGKIYRVSKEGGATEFADVGDFPVGVAFGTSNGFQGYLYVGLAYQTEYAVVRVDPNGKVSNFANISRIAGIAFSPDGSSYGKYLYAAQWPTGYIYRIDSRGNVYTWHTSIPGESRYIKFSHGGPFGKLLYLSETWSGKIDIVYPDASVSTFVDTGYYGIEGLEISPGGVWGHYLFVGVAFGANAGKILRIDPEGNVEVWADGFGSVADIHFQPDGKGGFTMYIVTGTHGEVWAISKAGVGGKGFQDHHQCFAWRSEIY